MESLRNLLNYWLCYKDDGDAFVNQELKNRKTATFDSSGTNTLHTLQAKHLRKDLAPLPFTGKLEPSKDRIYILSLNPGLSALDYYTQESKSLQAAMYREEEIKGITQQFLSEDYPNLLFNPDFYWHPGMSYWQRKLNPIIGLYFMKSGYQKTPKEMYQELSDKITFLELIPYHSNKAPGKTYDTMESVVLMKAFAKELSKIEDKNFLMIVLKGARRWGIKKKKNVVIYTKEAQAGSLGLQTKGGKAIRKFWNL